MGAILDVGQTGTVRGPQWITCLPFCQSQGFLQVSGMRPKSILAEDPHSRVCYMPSL